MREMKICNSCKQTKTVNQFFKNKDGKNGLRSSCKVCSKKVFKKWWIKNSKKQIARNKEWRAKNREIWLDLQRKNQKKYRERYPEKIKAHNFINNNGLRGSFCKRCGGRECLEAHHPDYFQPGLIETLCRDCHNKETYNYAS